MVSDSFLFISVRWAFRLTSPVLFIHSIHCTRCVRFATEVAGVQDLGVTGRGGMAEIGTYVSKLLTSELSGNVIDLCPVGALTSKPFAFTARAWELRTAESIDVTDGLGSNIRVDTRGTEVMRIVPRLHEGVNEEWISDKARFSYDGLKRQRLDTPMVRDDHGKLKPATWAAALEAVASKLKETDPAAVKAVAGKLSDAESIVALKDLMNGIGAGNTTAEGMEGVSADARSAYLFNSNIVGVEDADVVLLIGTDPRVEAPVLNARLRRANVAGGAHVASIGPHGDLTYPVEKLGESASAVEALASGKHAFAAKLKEAKNPLVIVGASLLRRPDRDALLKQIHAMCDETGVVNPAEGWNGFNVLHDAGGTVAALDLGFVPSTSAASTPTKDVSLVFSLGAESFDAPESAFVVYQGHHGDAGAARANVILPGAAYTEKYGTYVNTEGRAQRAMPAVTPHGQAREDWKILRALSECVGAPLPYDTLKGVRSRLADVAPHFAKTDEVEPALWLNGATYAHVPKSSAKVDDKVPMASSVENFYMTDAITRASATMAKCTKAKAAM